MSSIPDNQIEFFLHPVPFTALIIGFIFIAITICLIKVPKIRPYFKPLFKIYYLIAMLPLYLIAGLIYCVTLGKVNIFEKFKEVNFQEKFKKTYLEPKEIFEDMRLNPQNYHLWVGIYMYAVCVAFDYIFIIALTEMFYGGRELIIFGILQSEPPVIIDPIRRWVFIVIVGVFIWIPTKTVICLLALATNKYDNSDEPDRPWYDKVRLTYIAWGYILAADFIWCLGMILSLLVAIFYPSWEVLLFTWIFVIICGLVEMTYQQYSLQGIFKLGWAKGYIIWLLSMLPFLAMNVLFYTILAQFIN